MTTGVRQPRSQRHWGAFAGGAIADAALGLGLEGAIVGILSAVRNYGVSLHRKETVMGTIADGGQRYKARNSRS
jgi:hypothetical protein